MYDLNVSTLSILNSNQLDSNEDGKIIQKSVNSVVLKLIENCDTTDTISVYLEILKNYAKNSMTNKLASLANKCLMRIHAVIIFISKLFIELQQYY